MQADIHECVRCGQEFDLSKGGIVYKGREGLVHMCEEHIPDQFNDEALAEDMGVTLREDDAVYDGDYEPTGWHDDPQWDD